MHIGYPIKCWVTELFSELLCGIISVLRSGPVRFFCYFWTNRNRNQLPNTEIQKKPDQNRKKPQKTGPNQFERNQLKLIKTDQNQYFSSIY